MYQNWKNYMFPRWPTSTFCSSTCRAQPPTPPLAPWHFFFRPRNSGGGAGMITFFVFSRTPTASLSQPPDSHPNPPLPAACPSTPQTWPDIFALRRTSAYNLHHNYKTAGLICLLNGSVQGVAWHKTQLSKTTMFTSFFRSFFENLFRNHRRKLFVLSTCFANSCVSP